MTAGLIACLQGPSFLSAWPLRYFGKISYGLYLYHYPIMLAGKGHAPTLVLIGVSFTAAAISYEFVEKPFLKLKARASTSASGSSLTVASNSKRPSIIGHTV